MPLRPEKRTVTRGGKTFKQTFHVGTGSAAKGPAKNEGLVKTPPGVLQRPGAGPEDKLDRQIAQWENRKVTGGGPGPESEPTPPQPTGDFRLQDAPASTSREDLLAYFGNPKSGDELAANVKAKRQFWRKRANGLAGYEEASVVHQDVTRYASMLESGAL